MMSVIFKVLGPVIPYFAGALAAALFGVSGFAWLQAGWLEDLEAKVPRLESDLANCTARSENILEDKRDDATVGDPRNFDVPGRWIMPERPGAAR